jgi:N-acetylglucosamine-6-phosphate deacetylase
MNHVQILNGRLPVEFVYPAEHPQVVLNASEAGFAPASIFSAQGRIVSIQGDAGTIPPQKTVTTLDATGCYILPGFVDVHVHGSAGQDVMDATPAALATLANFFAQQGVTSFLPTTMTAPHAPTLAAVENVARVALTYAHGGTGTGARILGIHLEGPYLSRKFPGAQPIEYIRPPNLAEFRQLLAAGPVKMITLAPEEAGADELIGEALRHQVRVVLGHTNATYEQAQHAIGLGLSQATHTYNAMTGLHHRQPGTLGAVLTNPAIYAQVITDNVHVHPAAVDVLVRCKSVARTIVITDAIRATGLPPGEYDLGGQMVKVEGDECRLADGTLAGSVLTMDRGLRNFMAATGLSLAQAWPATSRTPAHALGLASELGSIAPGFWADLVLLDEALQVVATVVAGQVAYLREAGRLQ